MLCGRAGLLCRQKGLGFAFHSSAAGRYKFARQTRSEGSKVIESLGPASIGAVIGWMLYYFMRKYTVFSPKTLTATLAAFAGGPVLTMLERWAAGTDAELGLWYFLGVGAGFFTYGLYAIILSLLFAFGMIKSLPKFEIAVGCGAGLGEMLGIISRIADFETTLRLWGSEQLEDEAFKHALLAQSLTKIEYIRAKAGDGAAFDLDPELLERFEQEGHFELLRPQTQSTTP